MKQLMIFAAVFGLASIGAWGAADPGNFALAGQLENSPVWEGTAESTVRILTFGTPCTGFFISNTGYMLTSADCLTNALPLDKISNFIGQRDLAGYTGVRISAGVRGLTITNPQPDSAVQDISSQSPTLVATGDGFLTEMPPNTKKVEKATEQELSHLFVLNHDFAILKYSPPLEGKFNCLKTGGTPANDAHVYALGESNSRLFISRGLQASWSDAKLKNISGPARIYDPKWTTLYWLGLTDGMSGGPLLDSNQNLIGLVYNVAFGANDISQVSAAISINAIREQLVDTFGLAKANEIFTCR